MGRKIHQFNLLLWKNFLIQKRKVLTTVFEIGLPTFFALILIFIRLRVNEQMKTEEVWSQCATWDKLEKIRALPRQLAFSPDIPVVRNIMEKVKHTVELHNVTGFSSEGEMVDFLMLVNNTVNNTRDYLGGVAFVNSFPNDSFPDDIFYKVRLSSSPRNSGRKSVTQNPLRQETSWSTEFMFPVFQRVGPREPKKPCGGSPGYVREGFLAIQHAVNMAILETIANSMNQSFHGHNVSIHLQRHPYPQYDDDNFILVIQKQLPLVLMLSMVLVALNIVKDVVHEKERKLKESMKMMGLNNWLHWAAWFTKYFLFLLITVLIMTLFFCVPTSKGAVIGRTSPVIVFLFLMIYSISTISFCFAVSVFFSKANSGAAAGGIAFFVTYIPYFFLQPRYETLTWGQKMLSSLLSNVGMAYGGQIIGMYEGTGSGVQWSNIMYGVSIDDSLSLFDVLVMQLVDTVIYAMITWYVEAVFPGDYGVPQKWYFLFQYSYWCGTRPEEFVPDDMDTSSEQNAEYFEADPVGVRPGISIRDLRKVFKGREGKKVAVSGMTLNMYEGQITALLGHNGAGKTTTMSMLTGFIPPSGGTAYVNGFDIREDLASVRSSLGLCPQHDVLFDTLTVEEHLIFFAKLKGCKLTEVPAAVDDMLNSINLKEKRRTYTKKLSGGMKRKLSVGIALIGGSKIVILDEPSSGLDPNARRQIWSVLQQNRAGRTMVLTTHFMDEADLLGDRIAIMADGVVKCCGSSLFLKNKYGAGYHMTLVQKPSCDVTMVTKTIQKHVPEGKLESNVGAELSYILPHEMAHKFEELFSEIDEQQEELGISSYGASVTTMEEVFLRVGEASTAEQRDSRHNSVENDTATNEQTPLLAAARNGDRSYLLGRRFLRSASFTQDMIKNIQLVLLFQQFYAMFVKKAIHTFRNKLVTLTQLVVPLFFTIIALVVVKTFPGPHDSKSLNLTTTSIGVNDIVYAIANRNISITDKFASRYEKQFRKDLSTTVFCVNNNTHFETDPNMTTYLLDKGQEDIGIYNLRYLLGVDIDSDIFARESVLNLTAFFNNQALHSPAISVAMVANALLQFLNRNASLVTANHPLPRTVNDKLNNQMKSEATGFTVAFNVVFGMAFLASSFTLFLVKEKTVKAKHLQFTSGVRMYTFWPATFFWDLINYLMPVACLLFTLWAFNVDAFVVEDHLAHVFLLFLLYGCAMLPFMYLCSFLFTVPATGYVWLTMFNILSGVATLLAVTILSYPALNLIQLSRVLEWIFLVIIPNYCLAQGLQDYYTNYRLRLICQNALSEIVCPFAPNPCCKEVTGDCGDEGCIYNKDPLGWEADGIGRMLLFLGVQCVVYWCILLLLESKITHQLLQGLVRKSEQSHVLVASEASLVQEDDDVARERTRLANMSDTEEKDELILLELCKAYGSHVAVNHLSVGIPTGECFGLLGINGAGKTTTFKMLTGDETVSSGTAYLSGHSIISDIDKVHQNLGYCPQFDALIDQMTGRETLYMYARLRGIHSSQIPEVVDDLLEALLLTEHADKLVYAYSGGNKRKLSTAIALVGNPKVVFLDEPTTGMDPMARRFLWDMLCNIRAAGRTLVLTSHSMEECEALCTRLAVMVNGQFKCLGSPQHLKNKFGEGFSLLASVAPAHEGSIPDARPLMKFIEETFPGSVLKDLHQGQVHYHITDTSLKWAYIFGTMERAKSTYNIENYSVSQTTLEQVFVNFARAQVPPREPPAGCCQGTCCFPIALFSQCCQPADEHEVNISVAHSDQLRIQLSVSS